METPWIFFSWLWLQKAISYILFYPIGCPVTCLQVLIGSSLVVVFYQSSKSHLHIRDLSSVSPPRSLGNVKWNTIKGEPAVIHEHAPFGEVFSVMDEPDNTHFWDMSQFPWGFKKKFFFFISPASKCLLSVLILFLAGNPTSITLKKEMSSVEVQLLFKNLCWCLAMTTFFYKDSQQSFKESLRPSNKG